MAITYVCRHCRAFQGRIDSHDISEARLGFDSLTPEERRDIIAYDFNGEVMVRVTCDHCREALEAHPELSLLANPLQ
ncbi:anti-sigma-F factor Fin [Paenibacillus lautus]